MTEQKTLTPTIMADELGIQAITLRRWCTAFAGHLSPLANPSPGNARRFTYRDREVLKHVRSLRDQDRSLAEINEQLAGLTFPEIDNQPVVETQPAMLPESPVTTVTPSPQGAAPLVTQDYIISIERRFEVLEQANKDASKFKQHGELMFGAGFIAALLFVLVIVGIAVLYGGFR